MRLMIEASKNPRYIFLVTLENKKLRSEVADLLSRRRNSEAMAMAISRGRFGGQVDDMDAQGISVDLIISEDRVSWTKMR